jgi:chromosome partitioning protein
MSAPEPDILRRGQAIFDRLRSAGSEPAEPTDESDTGTNDESDESSPVLEAIPTEVLTEESASEPPVDAAPEPEPVAEADPSPASENTAPHAEEVVTQIGEAATLEEPPIVASPDDIVIETPKAEPEPESEPVVVPDPPSVAEIVGEAAALAAPATEPEVTAPAVEPGARKPHPASLRPLPRVIAVANQKGGVGKTTTTVNLGAGLAELGFRVLIIDLDPQGNATTGLGINQRNLESSVYDVLLHDVPLDDCIEPTSVRNLFVAPATIDLAGADIELVPAFSRELRLRRAIESLDDAFDYTIIDCPPSLGLITVNGLAAASEVIVPIQCEYYALEGLGQLLKNVNLVTGNLNPQLEVSAIVLTMYDSRTKLAEQVAEEVRHHFGEKVCRMVIPRTVRLSEAPSFGQPILTFDPTSRGAVAYRELAKEVSGGAA